MGDVPVVWASTRQTGVASSSCEAEYVAISDCVRRVCELRNFMTSIGRKPASPTPVRTDSQSASDALHGPVIAQRLRHIDIRMHRTRQAIDDGDVEITKVPTKINRADGLTKVSHVRGVLPPSAHGCYHDINSRANDSSGGGSR